MPIVNGKRFSYTIAGMRAADKYKKKLQAKKKKKKGKSFKSMVKKG